MLPPVAANSTPAAPARPPSPAEAAAAPGDRFSSTRNDVATLIADADRAREGGNLLLAHYLSGRARRLAPDDLHAHRSHGEAALARQELDVARACFVAALAIDPGHPGVNTALADCLLRMHDTAAASAAIGRAIAADPDTAPTWRTLAELANQAGAPALASRCFEWLALHAAADPSWWLARARFARAQGQFEQAIAWVDRFGRLHPHDTAARLEKARCLLALGRPDQAMRWLEQLERRQPGLPGNSSVYGECLGAPGQAALRALHWQRAIELWTAAGEFAPAQELAERLLREQPGHAPGWNALGRLEHAQGHWPQAEAAWRHALRLDPALLDAAAGLAHLLEESNRGDEAATVARAGLQQIRPGVAASGAIELHLALAKSARRRRRPNDGLAHLRDAEALARLDAQHEHIAFERGRLLELRHDDNEAFASFAHGNALALAAWQRTHPGPNPYLAGVTALLAKVRAGSVRPAPVAADTCARAPAFLVGFPRSGTSLLNHVLAGHEQIHAMEEKPPAQRLLAAVRAMPCGYPEAMEAFDGSDLDYLRDVYFRAAADHGYDDPGRLLLDKFPLHINLAVLLDRVFPQARFVFALRHPCDVVLSCFMQQFRLNPAMANFCTLGGTVELYVRTMELWQLVRERWSLPVHTIRYEDVVADFDGQTRALCEFLGVPWRPELARFAERAHERGRIDTPSYAQVSRPLYGEAVQRWHRYREVLAPWLPILQPCIERFGYA